MCKYTCVYRGKLYVVMKEWKNKYDHDIKLGQKGFSYEKHESCMTFEK